MSGDLTLVPAGSADREIVRTWLGLPNIRAFWGSASAAEAEVNLAFSSAGALCRMIAVDGHAVGYAHALDCALVGGDHAAALAPGTWDCALFIASPEHRGHGVGGRALRRLVAEVFSSTLAISCVIRVPVRSEAVVRSVEAAGFRWVRIEGDPALGPVWVMRADRERGGDRPAT